MKKSELKKALSQYRELQQQILQLEREKERTAQRIKDHMERTGLELVELEDLTARYQQVTSVRFDQAAFKEAHGRIYKSFCRPQVVRRFTIA